MRIAGITKSSYVNGPGRRNVLHVQGCTIGCPGCFNEHTWSKSGGDEFSNQHIISEMLAGNPDGITLSGGEPMEQWPALRQLLKELLVLRPALSVVIFTGWTEDKLERSGFLSEMKAPFYLNRTLVSMVIAGPYIEKMSCVEPLISSANQKIIYTNPACEQEDLTEIPRVEVHCEGSLIKISGLPDDGALKALKGGLV